MAEAFMEYEEFQIPYISSKEGVLRCKYRGDWEGINGVVSERAAINKVLDSALLAVGELAPMLDNHYISYIALGLEAHAGLWEQ